MADLFKPRYIDGRKLWKVFDQAGFFVDREDRDIAQQAIEDMMQNEGIEIENSCSGCIYENANDTTDAISNCVCCSRINDMAKNDYYRKI